MARKIKEGLRYCLYALLLLLVVAWGIYVLGFLFSAPYFAFADVREDGLSNWFFGGELKTGLKTLAWPFHAYRKFTEKDESWEEDYFSLKGDALPLPQSSLSIKPIRYMHLLECLEHKKSFDLQYATESGNPDVIRVRLSDDDEVVLERDVFLELISSSADESRKSFVPSTMIKAHVILKDTDKDSHLDSVEVNAQDPDWAEATQQGIKIEKPEDEKYTSLWHQSLGIIYRNSRCFRD